MEPFARLQKDLEDGLITLDEYNEIVDWLTDKKEDIWLKRTK